MSTELTMSRRGLGRRAARVVLPAVRAAVRPQVRAVRVVPGLARRPRAPQPRPPAAPQGNSSPRVYIENRLITESYGYYLSLIFIGFIRENNNCNLDLSISKIIIDKTMQFRSYVQMIFSANFPQNYRSMGYGLVQIGCVKVFKGLHVCDAPDDVTYHLANCMLFCHLIKLEWRCYPACFS